MRRGTCQDAAHFTTILRSYRRQTPSARKRSPEKPTPLQASTAQGSLSSMLAVSQTAILCRDVLQAGPASIAPSQKGRGRGGTGRERALRAPVNYFGCLFCCLGPLCVRDLKISSPRTEALTFKNDHTSRFVRAILAQGPY